MIEINPEIIDRAKTMLEGIPRGTERAVASAINRGLVHARAQAFREVKRVYSVKQSALRGETTVQVQKAGTGDPIGYVSFSGAKIPLYEFQVTPKMAGTGKKVRAAVMKGGSAEFDSAFIANMGRGTGVFERLTSKRYPTEQIMGLSAAQMIRNEDIITQIEEETHEKVNERLTHEIDRILNGYGGKA